MLNAKTCNKNLAMALRNKQAKQEAIYICSIYCAGRKKTDTECDVKQAVICQISVVTSLVGMPRVPLLRDKCCAEVGGYESNSGGMGSPL